MKQGAYRDLKNIGFEDVVRFLRIHIEIMLGGIAIFLAVMIVLLYIWGIALLAKNIGIAVSPSSLEKEAIGFNLEDAVKLNLRGLER